MRPSSRSLCGFLVASAMRSGKVMGREPSAARWTSGELVDPRAARSSSVVELRAGERLALGGALDLDDRRRPRS